MACCTENLRRKVQYYMACRGDVRGNGTRKDGEYDGRKKRRFGLRRRELKKVKEYWENARKEEECRNDGLFELVPSLYFRDDVQKYSVSTV